MHDFVRLAGTGEEFGEAEYHEMRSAYGDIDERSLALFQPLEIANEFADTYSSASEALLQRVTH